MGNEQTTSKFSFLSLIIIIALVAAGIFGVTLTVAYPGFIGLLSGGTYVSGGPVYDAIYVVLTLASGTLYLIGGAVITYGAVLVTVHFIKHKLKDPYKPTFSTRYLSGYLTLSLNFLIGAEIIRTVVIRTYDEIGLLILVILSRGLFSLILYLERRWHGTAETD